MNSPTQLLYSPILCQLLKRPTASWCNTGAILKEKKKGGILAYILQAALCTVNFTSTCTSAEIHRTIRIDSMSSKSSCVDFRRAMSSCKVKHRHKHLQDQGLRACPWKALLILSVCWLQLPKWLGAWKKLIPKDREHLWVLFFFIIKIFVYSCASEIIKSIETDVIWICLLE